MIVSEEFQPLQPPGTIPSDAPPIPIRSSSSKATLNNDASHTIRIPSSASVTTTAATATPTKSNNHRRTAAAAATTTTSNTTAADNLNSNFSASTCCCALLLFVLVIGFFICIVAAILALLQNAEDPEFHVGAVSMTSSSSNANASNYQTSPVPSLSDWNMNVSFVAKNNYLYTRMYYDTIRASLFYDEEFLSGTDIVAPFYLEPQEQTLVQASFGSWQPQVDKRVTTAIDGLIRSNSKTVKFDVKVRARVTTNPGSSSEDEGWMRIACEDIKVVFLSNNVAGAMLSKAKKCNVRY